MKQRVVHLADRTFWIAFTLGAITAMRILIISNAAESLYTFLCSPYRKLSEGCNVKGGPFSRHGTSSSIFIPFGEVKRKGIPVKSKFREIANYRKH
jgi:hypothetical protein